MPSRRQVVTGLAAAVASGLAARRGSSQGAQPTERPYLDAARGAGRWLARHAITTPTGLTWAADPRDETTVQHSLYSGSPGVVLFFLELHRATGDDAARRMAVEGAEYLAEAANAPRAVTAFAGEGAGLYTGLAGIVYTLERTAAGTGEATWREAALSSLALLKRLARPTSTGVAWSASNDIISGTAGIGLTLLWAATALEDGDAIDLAAGAGRTLVDNAITVPQGLTWQIKPEIARRYPNFSHGAAGVSYFLASLYEATQDRQFLDAALGGAKYLQAVARETASGGRMVFHSEPGNTDLFYLSWCHGPAGTARLFHRLGAVTRDRTWPRYIERLTAATRDMGVPARSPGFWNNVSQCCGNCGVIEYLVALHGQTGDSRHLDYARHIAADALARATAEEDGLKWIQAEHRVQPENLVAQTGLMQGAAGVGLAMLHLDGALAQRPPFITLPDSPW
jgi:lantibiotic modifying enzyme